MGRVSAEELDRLKRIPLLELVGRSVRLERRGSDFFGLCPFHDDHDPSLVVSPEKNLWHCLGACSTGGSTLDWVMKSKGVSFRHAVEILRAELGLSEASPAVPAPGPTFQILADLEDDAALLGQVVDFYAATFRESPEASSYLASRGLAHPEMASAFKIGFANRTLAYQLPSKKLKAGAAVRSRLQALGILRESGHEHFNGSVVVPIFDSAGRVVEMYGRKVTPNLLKGTPVHLYLPGPHAGVFNFDALRSSKEIIVCESILDALTFWVHGYRQVTAAFGVNGFTAEMVEAFQAYGVERVLIAYDRDEAGERGASSLAAVLAPLGIGCWRVQFPKGMDANDYAVKLQPAAKGFDLVLRNAVHLAGPKRAGEIGIKTPPQSLGSLESLPSLEPTGKPAIGPPPSSPLAEAPPALAIEPPKLEIPAEVSASEVVIVLGDRRYRVRGLAKNLSFDVLKINLLAGRSEAFFVDNLDLYSAKQRAVFIKSAAEEIGVKEEIVKKDLGKVLLKLEELQSAAITKALEPTQSPKKQVEGLARERALELLRDPRLLDRILEDFRRCGVVGEETNKLVGYLATISRQAEQPLAVLIQSSSAAGKTSLMDAVLSFVPEEERVKYSAMTGQSLFYMSETNLKHKVLALVEEEGAERATYALKLLQSEGELTIASTGKDPHSGKLVTHEYRVEGPVAILLTTTSVEIDEELLNRCLVLTVDEGREQTRAIHREQRERRTPEGFLARRQREAIRAAHQDAQRLLEPWPVLNPWARRLTFLDGQTRTRRDHEKYLTLIDTICLLHQHQRGRKPLVDAETGETIEHLEVMLEDIEAANRLAHEVLGHSLDELPPQTRRLLGMLDRWVTEQCARAQVDRIDYRFLTREVREMSGWGQTQIKIHLARLVDLEYLIVHRSQHGQGHIYELVYDGGGDDGKPFVTRLLDVEKLRQEAAGGSTLPVRREKRSGFEPPRSGSNEERSGHGRPLVGPRSGGGRGSDFEEKSLLEKDLEESTAETAKNAYKADFTKNRNVPPISHRSGDASEAA